MKNIILFLILLLILSCGEAKFLPISINESAITKAKSDSIKKCLQQKKKYLENCGLSYVRNNSNNRFYLKTKSSEYASIFELNCSNINNINIIRQGEVISSKGSYNKIYLFKKNDVFIKINHGFKRNYKAAGFFHTSCDYYENGALKSCQKNRILFEIDSLSREMKRYNLGF